METQHIIGRLTPANPAALSERTYKHIYNAVMQHKLYGIVFSPNWETGELTLDNRTPDAPSIACDSALDLITRITGLINSTGLAELKLQGQITVIVPRVEPVVFKLLVKDRKVVHQQAQLEWSYIHTTI